MNKRIVLSLLFLLYSSTVVANEWKVETKVDAMTDETRKSAIGCNESGCCFSIYRAGKEVWANFSLPDGNSDVLSHERFPMYRVDKNKPVDLDETIKSHVSLLKVVGDNKKVFASEPKWLNWLIHHGEISKPVDIGGHLGDIVEGNEILFRYYLFTGGSKETVINLNGAKNSIFEVLGLDSAPSTSECQQFPLPTPAQCLRG